ncbi:lantibiotic dehydratase [Thermoflavimicrobium dichotomicum]|uniref:lantibiotic dehydratase n=1 Tax=Thermoflavimicrobium dichotomicum TaxID=46223 RepID=UPI0015878BF1
MWIHSETTRLSTEKQVFQLANQPIYFHELLDKIQKSYPDVPKDTIFDFLWNLFRQEFLISELRPPSSAGTAKLD